MAVEQLGYLVFDMPEGSLGAMQTLLGELFGLEIAPIAAGGFDARMDGRPFRLRFNRADHYCLAAVGWETLDSAALADLKRRVTEAGYACTDLNRAQCALRSVADGFTFIDADGFPVEVFVDAPFAPAPELDARFICGRVEDKSFGIGHLVQCSADKDSAIRFYSTILGLDITDRIVWPDADLMFFHCNNRHHSLAIAGEVLGLQAGGIDHFMIEVRDRAEVDRVYARLEAAGFQVSMTLGEHTNDGMYSFYVYAPAPFRIEFGHGGRDARTCAYQVFDAPSSWGHEFHPPQFASA
ncbi:MAG: VOC family protein [Sphingobium sp.]|nr:VOC family protein [Sphingobium sp.]MBP8671869.1 VOC family protein [Sphingobium sp.]MBP9158885.1 VOC family protein [Sphingobium sp.]MCC6482170.1 VOC family protein [Sphingomonadaceae bacterium]